MLIKPFGQCCITFQFPGSITSFLTFILRCHESSESATAHAPSVEHSGQIFSKPPRILMRSQWPLFSMFSSCIRLDAKPFDFGGYQSWAWNNQYLPVRDWAQTVKRILGLFRLISILTVFSAKGHLLNLLEKHFQQGRKDWKFGTE